MLAPGAQPTRDRETTDWTPSPLDTLDESLARLRTCIYTHGGLAAQEQPVVARPLSDDLTLVLAYERMGTLVPVAERQVALWRRLPDELFHLGLDNVRAQGRLEHTMVDAQLGLRSLHGGGPGSAAQALALDDYAVIDPQRGALVAVPSQGEVLYHVIDDRSTARVIPPMALAAQSRFDDAADALTSSIYWWRPGQKQLVRLPTEVKGKKLSVKMPVGLAVLLPRSAS